MPYASSSPTLTVQALLKQPALLSRELVNLVNKRLIADRLFLPGSPDQVAGGAMRYQELESIYVDDDPSEIAEGADFPMTDWSEAVKTAAVRQYGFGVRITNLAVRRNQRDMVQRGLRKLANRLTRRIDSLAMAVLTDTATYPAIQTNGSAAVWTTVGTDIIDEIAEAQELLELKDNGYDGFSGATLVLNTARRQDLLNNTALRAALPRETESGQIRTGMIAPFLGLGAIVFTPQCPAATAILMDSGIAGTIADERPDGTEGWSAYDPGPGFRPIYTKVEKGGKPMVHSEIFAGRWPAIALVQPDAVVNITSIA
ncbi:MAG TPA: hypothetical protein VI540_03670 [Gaiellaceae bacterium]|nr:hypothetical protein [Gaiellaceae bacterium]